MKLVLALQYYSGDREAAMRLARLIADIEPAAREDVELLIVRRHDAEPFDVDTLAHVAGKLRVSVFDSRSGWTGWPAGPNGLARDTLAQVWGASASPGRAWSDTTGILLLEPDCVPIQRDWLKQIKNHWMLALLDNCWLMGSWRNSGGEFGHINGAMMVRPDFAKLVDLGCITPHLAWDVAIVPQVRKKWCVSGLFLNRFQETNATEEVLSTPETGGVPPVLCHGFKDDSAYGIARKWLNL